MIKSSILSACIMFMAAAAPLLGHAQSEKLCHIEGDTASTAAESRDGGLPLAEIIDGLYGISESQTDQVLAEQIRKRLDSIIIAVYSSKLSKDEVYLQFRTKCEQEGWYNKYE